MNIKYIQIYGERNSGTNFLHFLLEKNIKGVKVGYRYGWKHGFAKLDKLKEKAGEDTLVMCIFKDPYSWLVSMHGKPHHAPQLMGLPLSNFLKEEWACYEGDNYDKRDLEKNPVLPEQEMMWERNPETGERFENVVQVRTAKAKRLLQIKDVCPKVMYVRYEDLLARPRIYICDIAGKFRLRLNGPVQVSMGYFGKNPKAKFDRKDYYAQKKYLEKYKPEDLAFINQHLDEAVEKELGYDLVTDKVPHN